MSKTWITYSRAGTSIRVIIYWIDLDLCVLNSGVNWTKLTHVTTDTHFFWSLTTRAHFRLTSFTNFSALLNNHSCAQSILHQSSTTDVNSFCTKRDHLSSCPNLRCNESLAVRLKSCFGKNIARNLVFFRFPNCLRILMTGTSPFGNKPWIGTLTVVFSLALRGIGRSVSSTDLDLFLVFCDRRISSHIVSTCFFQLLSCSHQSLISSQLFHLIITCFTCFVKNDRNSFPTPYWFLKDTYLHDFPDHVKVAGMYR